MATYFREFIRYVSLNVLGMLGLSCYILADTYFVSKGLGADGLAALNLAIPVYSFIHGSGLLIGMGGGTRYAIFKHQGEERKAGCVFTHALWFALGLSAGFVLLGLLGSEKLARLLGADETVFAMNRTYLQVILLFAPAFLLNNLCLCFVRNDGAPQLSMAAMLGGSLSNVVLDYLFLFPGGMGIFGAAFATGLAPIISLLILSPHFIRRKNGFHPIPCRPRAALFAGIFSSGLPSLVTEASSGVVMIVFNGIFLRLQGNTGVAAYGVIANLSLVVIAVYTGIAQGIQPLISRYTGAGDPAAVRRTLRYATAAMLLVSGLVYGGIFFGASPIAGIFNSGHDNLLQTIAVTGLRLYFLACPFAGFNVVYAVYFTSINRPRPAHVLSLLRGFVLILPLAFLLAALGGIRGVWLAFPAAELLTAGVGLALFLRQRKREAAARSA